MRTEALGQKMVIFTKSGNTHEGTLRNILRDEIVLEIDGDNGKLFMPIFKDSIESWATDNSKLVFNDEDFLVVKCVRKKPHCKGRVAFSLSESDNREDLEDAVVCNEYDAKACNIVAAKFFDMDDKTKFNILNNVRLDFREGRESKIKQGVAGKRKKKRKMKNAD